MFSFKSKAKPEVAIEFKFNQKISRLFIFRGLWLVVAVWPMAVLGVWMAILSFIQFFHMLVLGQRSRALWDGETSIIRFFVAWQSYLKAYVDARPKFWIED